MKDAVDGVHTGRPFTDRAVSLESAYYSQVTGGITGSGICLKLESGPLSKKDARKVGLEFAISDGNYQVNCIVHNGSVSTLPSPKSNEEMTHALRTVTESIRNGTKVAFSGAYVSFNKDLVFVIDSISPLNDFRASQLSDQQLQQFLDLCRNESITPLELMMREDTLGGIVYSTISQESNYVVLSFSYA